MASLFEYLKEEDKKEYHDRSNFATLDDQRRAKKNSLTVYVGNLSFYTTETQLYSLFSLAGPVDRVIMGLHRVQKTPCGFCFVIFMNRQAVVFAKNYLNGTVVDGKKIKVEIDPGFKEGRQFGRARSGGQVQDDRRTYHDPQRGGAPKRMKVDTELGRYSRF